MTSDRNSSLCSW